MNRPPDWLIFSGFIVAILLPIALWHAAGFALWYRRLRKRAAALAAVAAPLRSTLPPGCTVGNLTFDRWKLFDALLKAPFDADDSLRSIERLLDRNRETRPAELLFDALRLELSGDSDLSRARQYLLGFECPQCGAHPPRALELRDVKLGSGGRRELKCPDGHDVLPPEWWISRSPATRDTASPGAS
ncbi:MAG: hypothetical protein IPJ65_20925 [Archangiaceae bacterium]|nr:hypothetical protein [Archangiaceae bacterium]